MEMNSSDGFSAAGPFVVGLDCGGAAVGRHFVGVESENATADIPT